MKEVYGVFSAQIQKGGAAGLYFTGGKDRAFEMLMQGKPGFDRYENGCAEHENCNTCHFYRPHWKQLKGLSLINREKIDAIREAIRELERTDILSAAGNATKKDACAAQTKFKNNLYQILEKPTVIRI